MREDLRKALHAEIERLRTEKIEANLEFAEVQAERERKLHAEIERLRAALRPFAKMYAAPGGDLDKAIQEARLALEEGK